MTRPPRRAPALAAAVLAGLFCSAPSISAAPRTRAGTPVFTAATYNLANWGPSDRWIDGKHVENTQKPDSERRAALAILRKINPDILAVQEILRDPKDRHFEDFRDALRAAGLDYPEVFAITGFDERIQLALFSRFPMPERHALNRDQYDLTLRQGTGADARSRRTRRRVERGFIHAIIEVRPSYRVEVFAAHLKSQRPFPEFDAPGESGQALIRRREAEILRRHIQSRTSANPDANVLILGDLNDTLDSHTLQIIAGRKSDPIRFYPLWLQDYLRDAWTHFFTPDRTYAMIDYAIASQGLFNEYSPSRSFIYRERPGDPTDLRWDNASDHRPVVAAFYAADLSYPEKDDLEKAARP